ncbi:MAG: metallophosphoesterase [Nanoarchaeota archaeon]|nr:metallophosphoesterase [Nanoarchaeota archaeon]MBU1027563.1 metallophosphoesterase [Nanoarchaeota archaeon]
MDKKNKALTKKTKILAIGDIHGDTGLVKKLAQKAKKENVDVVILAGDLTFAEMSLKNIIGPFAKAKKTVLIVPGNHEAVSTTAFLSEMYAPYSKHLHGYSFKKEGVGFFGAGTAEIGPNVLKDQTIFNLLKKSHFKIKNSKKKIMVTHMHPEGSKSEFSGFPGSKAIKRAIIELQPDIAICSHIHEAAGLEDKIGKTKVINVSRKAKIFEI